MKKTLTIILLLHSLFAKAQTLQGTVKDTADFPLEEVLIFNISTQNHTHTDANGFFEIKNISLGNVLEISCLGFGTQIFTVRDFEKLDIVLQKTVLNLSEVVVTSSVQTFNHIAHIDLETQPVNSSQELLRKVPGLFIGQHAGGGKAEQIFLRGFDIDHGTDIAIDADGVPVNMISHAHGQGYADLHFIIPETIEKIDFDKGSYYADKGNLATAGYVSFKSKDILEKNTVGIEVGQFATKRALTMFNLVNSERQKAYIASEFLQTDGAFESPQNFDRFNIMGKFTQQFSPKDKFLISFSHFKSKWDASGQIPQRAVNQGLITRFGAIDDTEGGKTQRTSLVFNYQKNVSHNTVLKSNFYYSRYDFELFSNFTFFLRDSIIGDQIKQKENRNIIGGETKLERHFHFGNTIALLHGGIGFRNDAVRDNELSYTKNRSETLENVALGNVNETNTYAYLSSEFEFGKWLVAPALRGDFFDFQYQNQLDANYKTASVTKAFFSPKLNISYQIQRNYSVYAKFGRGFHSNDTRVVVAQQGKEILPQALGADVGFSSKITSKLLINSALWYLHLDQEFVYVGDEGVVEAGGKTTRKGLDVGLRYQIGKSIFLNSDATYTIARNKEDNSFIPLAPLFTYVGGVSFLNEKGFSGGINARYLGDRPANEDNSIVAKGYFVCDANLNYNLKNGVEIGLNIQNIFNTAWNETQFATETRLKNESQSMEEIHFTPGTPFFAKASVRYRF